MTLALVPMQWLNDNMIKTVWQDPMCGDSVCEAPFEYKGWGGDKIHGCPEDCGFEKEVTNVTVFLDYTEVNKGDPAGRPTNLESALTVL